MRNLWIIPLLVGCAIPAAPDAVDLDDTPITQAIAATQPEPLVALMDQPHRVVGTEAICPVVTALPAEADAIHERWDGGCFLSDGTEVLGHFERFDGPHSAWVSGDGFALVRDDETLFALDGAIELIAEGSLWLLDANATLCGTETWSCERGPVGLDLAFTLYPASLFPHEYDTTVSGVVATIDAQAPMTVDGAWSVDDTVCDLEASSGLLTVVRGEHHALVLDGATTCDGCGHWQVQGRPTPGFCGLTP